MYLSVKVWIKPKIKRKGDASKREKEWVSEWERKALKTKRRLLCSAQFLCDGDDCHKYIGVPLIKQEDIRSAKTELRKKIDNWIQNGISLSAYNLSFVFVSFSLVACSMGFKNGIGGEARQLRYELVCRLRISYRDRIYTSSLKIWSESNEKKRKNNTHCGYVRFVSWMEMHELSCWKS